MMASDIIIDCGAPKPRNAVLEAMLVLQTRPTARSWRSIMHTAHLTSETRKSEFDHQLVLHTFGI